METLSPLSDARSSEAGPSAIEWETVDCPLCGSPRYSLVRLVRDLLVGSRDQFQLVRCRDCSHVFLNPRPTPQSILRYYPDDYGPHHNVTTATGSETETAAEAAPWYLSRGVRAIPGLRRAYYWLMDCRDVLLPVRPESTTTPRLLELGCSDGDYLLRMKQQGWETVGIEPVAAPAARARQRNLDVRSGVLEPGMFAAESFDAVCAWHVIEHLHDPRSVVEELARILKPDGELLLSLPNYGCWEPRVFGDYWLGNEPPIHLQQFTPRTLRRLLESCGFRIITCDHQRNLSNVVGSVGLWLREKRWLSRLAERCLRFPNSPTTAGQLLLALPAKLLAVVHQGGRLTVRARRNR